MKWFSAAPGKAKIGILYGTCSKNIVFLRFAFCDYLGGSWGRLERTWGRVGWFRRCLGGRFGQDFDVMERLREVLGLARAMYKKLCGTHQMRLLPILA